MVDPKLIFSQAQPIEDEWVMNYSLPKQYR